MQSTEKLKTRYEGYAVVTEEESNFVLKYNDWLFQKKKHELKN